MATETINKCDICGKECKPDIVGYKEITFSKAYYGMFGYGDKTVTEKTFIFCDSCDYNFRDGVKKGFMKTLKTLADNERLRRELQKAETTISRIQTALKQSD